MMKRMRRVLELHGLRRTLTTANRLRQEVWTSETRYVVLSQLTSGEVEAEVSSVVDLGEWNIPRLDRKATMLLYDDPDAVEAAVA